MSKDTIHILAISGFWAFASRAAARISGCAVSVMDSKINTFQNRALVPSMAHTRAADKIIATWILHEIRSVCKAQLAPGIWSAEVTLGTEQRGAR